MSDIAVLTSAEADLLEQAEATIARGIKAFREVGDALISVRENRLYRAEYVTFEDYCRDRWQLERATAYRAIQSAQVASILSPIGEEIKNEAQARELAPLLESPDDMRAAFTEAIARSDGKPTAAVIREVVRERMDPASPLAQAAERELDKLEARPAPIPEAERFTPERIAEIEDFVRPAVQFGRLVSACEWFLEQLAEVDFDAAIRGMKPEQSRPIHEAVRRLAQIRSAVEVAA